MSLFFSNVEGDDNVFILGSGNWSYTSEVYSRMPYEHTIGFLSNGNIESRLLTEENGIVKTTPYANNLIDDKLLRFRAKVSPYMRWSSNGGYVQPDFYLNGSSIKYISRDSGDLSVGLCYIDTKITETIYLVISGTNNTPYTINFSPYGNSDNYGLVLIPEYGYYGS